MRQGLSIQESLLQPDDGHLGEMYRLLSQDRDGPATAVFRQLHRQDPFCRMDLDSRECSGGQPDRLPGARPQAGVAAVPAVWAGTERLLHPARAYAATLP